MQSSVARIQEKQALQKNSGFSSLGERELQVIKKQFFPHGADNEEINYCISVAKQLDLNPLMKEIMFVPRRQKINGQWVEKHEPLVGRDGFLSIAHKTGQLAGIETECSLKEIPILTNKGWEYKKELVARCTVYRKDTGKPFVVEVSFNEYAQRTKEGNLTAFWRDKPETMLKKVAESQCLRKAFNINGIYGAEEIGYGTYTQDGGLVRDVDAEANIQPINDISEQPEKKPTQTEDDKTKVLEELANKGFEVSQGKASSDYYVAGNSYGKPMIQRLLKKHFQFVMKKDGQDIYKLIA